MKWWRVEHGPLGIVVSVTEVREQGHPDAMVVFYVRAEDEHGAKREAAKERHRELQRQRRAWLDKMGYCRCGRQRDGDGKKCVLCLEKQRADLARMRARKRGEQVATPPKAEAFAERKAEDAARARMHALLDAREAWLRAQTNAEFSEWLRTELEAVGITTPEQCKQGSAA